MTVYVVIPARYASSRYPGKPLVELTGATGVRKSLVRRAWEAARAVEGVDGVYVATDDDRIAEHARAFGADILMTPESCRNGTERCAAALPALPTRPDIVVNLQGDAPLTPAYFVSALINAMRADPSIEVATPALPADGEALRRFRADRAAGLVGGTTVVATEAGDALYFSKEVVPFGAPDVGDAERSAVRHHVGLYAYTADALERYAAWAPGLLERLEGLEQLRFLERGRRIRLVEVDPAGRAFWELNNPIDAPRVEAALAALGIE